ncbi:MAG TPA: hypothetical protein VG826_20085 [Pirellulales bacterium]|nr:hypothetical protein [Pirellulales bacterium]
MVKPHDGPWLLVWRAGLGLAPSDRFVYQAIDEQEAAEFALSRGYVPAELRELVADRCLGKPPCDEQGDEVEIKRFLWLQGKTHDTAVQTLPGATGPFMPAPAELTSAEFPAADESVSRLPPAGYLGLRVDDARRTITRDGFPATVNLQDSRILWAIFKKLVLNHDVPVAHEAIVGLWEANGVARMPSVGTVNDAVAELRNQLKAIGITIEVKRKVGRLLAELPLPADKAKARRPKKKK